MNRTTTFAIAAALVLAVAGVIGWQQVARLRSGLAEVRDQVEILGVERLPPQFGVEIEPAGGESTQVMLMTSQQVSILSMALVSQSGMSSMHSTLQLKMTKPLL